MKISIVIPAYNEEKYIGRTLESARKLELEKDREIEVLIIDAASTDKTAEIAQKYGARVIEVKHKGIGFARQEGIKHAKGEIIAFTDADTIVPRDWLTSHIKALKTSGVVCSFGGYRFYDGSFPLYQIFNYIQPILVYLFYKLFYFPAASGQNIAFWRDKALLVGGFDEKIQVMEDTDLASRMKEVGKVVYLPDLLIYASGRRSREGVRFYLRMLRSYIQYFFLGKKALERFPDFR